MQVWVKCVSYNQVGINIKDRIKDKVMVKISISGKVWVSKV